MSTQLCLRCFSQTGRCEEDALYIEGDNNSDIGPLCDDCYDILADESEPREGGE